MDICSKAVSKIICIASPLAFGVYLIHDNRCAAFAVEFSWSSKVCGISGAINTECDPLQWPRTDIKQGKVLLFYEYKFTL